jgi:HAE1 family hydrophobic/amphiphilic exporter-1
MPLKRFKSCCTAFAKTYTYEFSGLTREEIIAGNQAIGVFLLSLIVYFLLSAQYESYLVPLSILLSLPVVAGAIGFVYLAGLKTISTSRSL